MILIFKNFKNNLIFFFWLIFIVSFSISVFQTEKNQILSFYSLHSRIWEFSLGALSSLYLHEKKIKFSNLIVNFIPLLGLILIFISLIFVDHNYKHPSYLTLIPAIGTFLIILFSSKNNFITIILSSKILVWIGLISYSLYMWHYPIFAYAELIQFVEGIDIEKNILSIFAFIFLIFFISTLSYLIIEKPFRNKKFKFKQICIFLLLIFALSLGLNFYVIKEKGKINPENTKFESFLKNEMVNLDCKFYSNKSSNFFDDSKSKKKFENCKKKYKKFILIIGDSHAGNLYNAIAKSSDYQFILGLIKDACRPSKNKNCQFSNAEIFISKEIKSIKDIIITHKGSFFLTNTGNANNENYTLTRKLPIIEDEVNKTLKYLKKINKLSPVIFVGPHIEPNIFLTKKNIKYLLKNGASKFEKNLNLDLIKVDEYLEKEMKKNNIRYISKIKQLNFDLKKDYVVKDKITFKDIGHWSDFGEYYFGKKLFENNYLKNLKKN
tara:strand:- start:2297 stop:3778 length:1482 start_codon:yes stop_codon:yes gene_type:complete